MTTILHIDLNIRSDNKYRAHDGKAKSIYRSGQRQRNHIYHQHSIRSLHSSCGDLRFVTTRKIHREHNIVRADRVIVVSRTVFVPSHKAREQQSVEEERAGQPAKDAHASGSDRAANECANLMGAEETLAIQ